MKAFVTGGSGFAGRHVVSKLVEKGYEVVALAHSAASADTLAALGAKPLRGSVIDRDSMREGMRGSDIVLHMAEVREGEGLGREQVEAINVGGTRKVLRLAIELGVPRIVHVSNVGVYGDTQGKLVDESYVAEGPFNTEYDRTKWLAHYKVAIPLIEKGAPIIIVVPGSVYGPGDQSFAGDIMRLFYRGFPAVPGPDTVVTFAHVEDVATGILLAAEKGRLGETYIMAGPAVSLGDMIDFWALLTGRAAPRLHVPSPLIRAAAPVTNLAGQFTDLKFAFGRETVRAAGQTYMARSDKAREELGWTTRPLQTGMLETFDWIAATEAERAAEEGRARERQIAWIALGAAALLFGAWLWHNWRQQESPDATV